MMDDSQKQKNESSGTPGLMRTLQAKAVHSGYPKQKNENKSSDTPGQGTTSSGTSGLMRKLLASATKANQRSPLPLITTTPPPSLHPAFPYVKMLLSNLIALCHGTEVTLRGNILSDSKNSECVETMALAFIAAHIPSSDGGQLQTWLHELKTAPQDTRFTEHNKITHYIKLLLNKLTQAEVTDAMIHAFVHQFLAGQHTGTWLKGLMDKCDCGDSKLVISNGDTPAWWMVCK